MDEPIALAEAAIEGREFTVERERYKTIDGQRRKATVASKPRPWWFAVEGKFFAEIHYGNRARRPLRPGPH